MAEFINGYHQGFHACVNPNDVYSQDTSDFPDLKLGQHYGTCEERGDDNHLACDVLNEGEVSP